jgi:hypothetical protein
MKNEKRKFFMLALIGAHGPLLFYTMFKPTPFNSTSTDTESSALVSNSNFPFFKSESKANISSSFQDEQGTEAGPTSLEQWLDKLLYNTEEENQELAAFLREYIRKNPAALEAVSKMMMDPNTPIRSFANLAMILGTLDNPEVESLLLQTLELFEADPDRAQWVTYALGTWKNSPSVDDRFSFHDRGPNTLKTIEGLATPIFHKISNPKVREAMLSNMTDRSLDLRLASTLALRHSLSYPDVYNSFFSQLSDEPHSGSQTIIAEAIARNLPHLSPAEQVKAVDELLLHAAVPEAQGLRLKILHPLQGAHLTENHNHQLNQMAVDNDESSIRRFALNILSAQSQHAAAPDPILFEVAHNDPDANTRAAAVSLIQQHPAPINPEQLIPILQNDSSWNVRHSTVQALSELPPEEAAAANALNAVKDAALNDADPKVSQYALSVLHGLVR